MNDIINTISKEECEDIMAVSELQSFTGLWIYSIPEKMKEKKFSFQEKKDLFFTC